MRSFLWRIKCVHCCLPYPLLFQRPWLKEDATDALCGGKKTSELWDKSKKKKRREKRGGCINLLHSEGRRGLAEREKGRGERGVVWSREGKQCFFFFYRVGWREREKKSGRWLDGPQHTKGHALHCNCCARRRLGFSPRDNNPHSLLLFWQIIISAAHENNSHFSQNKDIIRAKYGINGVGKKMSHTSVCKYLTFSFLLLITNNMVRFQISENISPLLSLTPST